MPFDTGSFCVLQVKSDKRFFLKHHGKQRKTAAGLKAKETHVSSQLTGPKAFPLDRMMAIFYSIVDDEVSPLLPFLPA